MEQYRAVELRGELLDGENLTNTLTDILQGGSASGGEGRGGVSGCLSRWCGVAWCGAGMHVLHQLGFEHYNFIPNVNKKPKPVRACVAQAQAPTPFPLQAAPTRSDVITRAQTIGLPTAFGCHVPVDQMVERRARARKASAAALSNRDTEDHVFSLPILKDFW
jgi:hypothetical protein